MQKKDDRRWLRLIPAPIFYLFSFLIVKFLLQSEVKSFYDNPEHIGFPFPLLTFMAAAILIVICFIVTIICLVLFLKKPKQAPNYLVRCPNCGNQIPETAAFCTFCGTKL